MHHRDWLELLHITQGRLPDASTYHLWVLLFIKQIRLTVQMCHRGHWYCLSSDYSGQTGCGYCMLPRADCLMFIHVTLRTLCVLLFINQMRMAVQMHSTQGRLASVSTYHFWDTVSVDNQMKLPDATACNPG